MNAVDMKIAWITIALVSLFNWTLGFRLIPERTEFTYVNDKYLYNASARVVRYGRKSTYYYNMEGGIRHTWGNNITVQLLFFENVNNQFKSSFMELHLKLCDMLDERDQFFGKMFAIVLKKFGVTCPAAPGIYRFINVTLPSEKLPNILLFQKGKLDLKLSQLPTHDVVATLYTTFSIKQN